MNLPELTPEECATYEWQMWLPSFGEAGQRKLKAASVLIARVGGLGGVVAQQLAAAGVGRLILATGGRLKPSDLNRAVLQRADRLGEPRIDTLTERLRQFNPRLEIIALGENPSVQNADALVAQADIVVDAAPLFEERYALNDAAVRAGKPMVECAVHGFEAQVITILPGRTPCLRCFTPEPPPDWRRQFPILGAVSGVAGSLGAIEVVKLLTGLGDTLAGTLLRMDLATMHFRRFRPARRADCPACGGPHAAQGGATASSPRDTTAALE